MTVVGSRTCSGVDRVSAAQEAPHYILHTRYHTWSRSRRLAAAGFTTNHSLFFRPPRSSAPTASVHNSGITTQCGIHLLTSAVIYDLGLQSPPCLV